MPNRSSRITGSIFGAALGDAIGRPTEFMQIPAILDQWGGPLGVTLPDPALVTDDTEMMLAVGDAAHWARYSPDAAAEQLIRAFKEWYHLPKAGRAAGVTCMAAIAKLVDWPRSCWQAASQVNSKGCGANMRVQSAAYLRLRPDQRAGFAQLQAAMTHGHPTALAASDLTQEAINLACRGVPLADLPGRLRAYALTQRTIYRETWLGDLVDYALRTRNHTQHRRWIAYGWNECLRALDRLDRAPTSLAWVADPCTYTGAGWIAEQALVTGLYCALLYPDNPVTAIRRAAITGGDSDSIACLTGSLVGAAHGIDGWPAAWTDRIEYRNQLRTMAIELM